MPTPIPRPSGFRPGKYKRPVTFNADGTLAETLRVGEGGAVEGEGGGSLIPPAGPTTPGLVKLPGGGDSAASIDPLTGKLRADQVPTVLDVRLNVLEGSTAALDQETLGASEIVINRTTNRLEFGDGAGGRIDPFKDLDISAARAASLVGERLIASLAAVWPSNAGTAHFATTRANSGTFTVRTSTGYARLINPDGTLGAQAGTGDAASSITLTIPAGGGVRAFGVLSVANGGSVRSGNITFLRLNNNQLTSFDGAGMSALTSLSLNNNQLTSFDGAGMSALTYLSLNNNQLTSFDGAELSALTYLDLSGNQLTSFDGAELSALTYLSLNNNQLTSFDGAELSALTYLDLGGNQLTSFNGTGLSALIELYLSGNQLTSITGAASFGGSYEFYGHFGNNALSAAALDDLYTQLRSDPPPYTVLSVADNPGTATDNPAIATAKGWSIYGS